MTHTHITQSENQLAAAQRLLQQIHCERLIIDSYRRNAVATLQPAIRKWMLAQAAKAERNMQRLSGEYYALLSRMASEPVGIEGVIIYSAVKEGGIHG